MKLAKVRGDFASGCVSASLVASSGESAAGAVRVGDDVAAFVFGNGAPLFQLYWNGAEDPGLAHRSPGIPHPDVVSTAPHRIADKYVRFFCLLDCECTRFGFISIPDDLRFRGFLPSD